MQGPSESLTEAALGYDYGHYTGTPGTQRDFAEFDFQSESLMFLSS